MGHTFLDMATLQLLYVLVDHEIYSRDEIMEMQLVTQVELGGKWVWMKITILKDCGNYTGLHAYSVDRRGLPSHFCTEHPAYKEKAPISDQRIEEAAQSIPPQELPTVHGCESLSYIPKKEKRPKSNKAAQAAYIFRHGSNCRARTRDGEIKDL